jgi:hypothetical protein
VVAIVINYPNKPDECEHESIDYDEIGLDALCVECGTCWSWNPASDKLGRVINDRPPIEPEPDKPKPIRYSIWVVKERGDSLLITQYHDRVMAGRKASEYVGAPGVVSVTVRDNWRNRLETMGQRR